MLILLYEVYLLLSGKLSDEELIMVKESEEIAELEELEKELHQPVVPGPRSSPDSKP